MATEPKQLPFGLGERITLEMVLGMVFILAALLAQSETFARLLRTSDSGAREEQQEDQLAVINRCTCGENTLPDASGSTQHVDPPLGDAKAV